MDCKTPDTKDKAPDKAILCVDDEVIILLSIIQELKKAFGDRFAYEQAIDAPSAYSAIDELAREGIRVILIISDWLMPGIRGDEFIEAVGKRHPEIKVIMITGQADGAALERIRKSESVIGILGKPWNPAELAAIIRRNVDG
ncbi:MAG TPA: response regulator [Treponemataceae bacterium]|nr:response regulator [Treponemataceae bacterium]HPS44291.1 response regulator [Treponemataceae bacterium]